MYESINIGKIALKYNHPHDVLGIVENYVLDVYGHQRINPGSTVIDLGAGIGDFSVLASKRVGIFGTVISVEPNPEDFNTLNENILQNGCENVRTINAAIYNERGKLDIEFKGKKFQAKTISTNAIMRSIDGDSKIYIKMDIEGYESLIVPLLVPYLNNVEAIFIELHNTEEEISSILNSLGFKFFPFKREDVLKKSVIFMLKHPALLLKFYRLAKLAQPTLKSSQILGNLEITGNSGLLIGSFLRN